MLRWILLALSVPLIVSTAGPARAGDGAAGSCLQLTRVTAFPPRGEVYVEVQAACGDEDFAAEDPIVAYLEVLVSDLPAVSQDVRIYREDGRRRETIVFRDLDLPSGELLLVRLVRFGAILGLKTITIP